MCGCPVFGPMWREIEIRGSEGAYEQEQRRRSASRDAYAEVHPHLTDSVLLGWSTSGQSLVTPEVTSQSNFNTS